MTVADPCPAYKAMEARRHLPRTLMGGTHAMQAAGPFYLPQEPAESDQAYRIRLNRSVLTNFYRRTGNNIVGKVFSKPIVLNDDVPSQLQEWMEDADLMGNHVNVFAQQVFRDAIEDAGISFILVDVPRSVENATKKDEQDLGIRPYFIHVKARDLIGWKSGVINGRETLTQVRIRENITKPGEDEFSEITIDRIRVLEPGKFRVFECNDDKEWVVVEEGVTTLSEIPLAVMYADRQGFMLANPPLEDLAYLNLTHWQSASDQRNILHVARVPILFGSGFDEETKVEIGASRMIKAPENADMKYVEHSGKGIDSGRQDLQDLEDAMRMFGLELQMPRTGTTTATARAMDGADAHSILQMWAIALGDCLEQAFMYAAQWAKLEQGGSVKVNTDFGISLRDASDVDALLKARQAREISRETFWSELRRRNVLIDDFDPDQETERLEAEGPALGDIPEGVDPLDSKVASLIG